MALSALPDTPAIVDRIRCAIDAAWTEWDLERKREGGRDRSPTSELKLRVWEMGFDYRLVYPKANQLGDGAQDAAVRRLTERGVPIESGLHAKFTMSEFLYDVAWMEYHEELAEERTFPPFKRTVLALESELGHERAVLYDFDKLLAAPGRIARDGVAVQTEQEQVPAGHGRAAGSAWSGGGGGTRLVAAECVGRRRT